jgi:hypothetical protein
MLGTMAQSHVDENLKDGTGKIEKKYAEIVRPVTDKGNWLRLVGDGSPARKPWKPICRDRQL